MKAPGGKKACVTRLSNIVNRLRILPMAVAVLVNALASSVQAAPMATPRVGGLTLASPTAASLTSLYWNPAALGRLRGTRFLLDGTLRITNLWIQRASIDPSTGLESSGPGSVAFPETKNLFLTPDCYGAFSTDLGGQSIVLGVAVYTPFAEMERLGGQKVPGVDAPLRYHRVRSDWFNLFVTPVVAARLHSRVFVGVGLSYVRSMVHMAYYRDRTIREDYRPQSSDYRVEDPRRSELVDLETTDNSFSFSLGILVNLPKRVRLGLSYRSRALGLGRTDIESTGKVQVTRWSEEQGWHQVTGRGRLFYDLPDSLSAGVEWAITDRWLLDVSFEWVHFGLHENLAFKFTGNAFRAEEMANWDVNFKRYRGFRDVWRVQTAGAYRPIEQLRLAAALLFESSALDSRWVNPAAVDGHKLDLLVSLEYMPHAMVTIGLGYSIQAMLPMNVESGFDPSATTRCVENRVDIVWSEDCNEVSAGRGLPTASGTYRILVQKIGLSVAFQYQ